MRNVNLKITRVELSLSKEALPSMVGVIRQTIGLIEAANKTLNQLLWREDEKNDN